jgi:phosphate transport system permease protein
MAIVGATRIRSVATRAHRNEYIATAFLRIASSLVVVSIGALIVYLASEGTKLFTHDHVSPFLFLFSPNFNPDANAPGSLVFIVGSLATTLFAIVVGGPFGIAVGVLLSELAPRRFVDFMKPAIEVLVGIPSVIYGWIGLTLLVPFIRNVTGSNGFGLFAAGVVLSVMILPTVITLSEDALRAVPGILREGSAAMGATRWQTIWRVLLPAARSGLMVAVILGIARAIGETMAVQLVIGNASVLPSGLLSPTASLPTEIVIDMAGAQQGSLLEHALFSMAFLLLLIAMALILAVRFAARRRA